jgi:hypothetical protein
MSASIVEVMMGAGAACKEIDVNTIKNKVPVCVSCLFVM